MAKRWQLATRTDASLTMLKALLDRYHLRARRRFSQNFLVDSGALAMIAGAIPRDTTHVIEIGAGVGFLTRALAASGLPVTAMEIDRALVEALRSEVADLSNVEVVEADAMRFDFPAAAAAAAARAGRLCVAGNLPYAIATPLIARLLESEPPASAIVATIQREVAHRLLARPRTKAYGALTLLVQSYAAVERVAELPAAAFFPRPKVTSTVVRLLPLEPPLVPQSLRRAFRDVVRAAFCHRRKMLRNTFDEAVLHAAGIDGTRRPEELTLDEFRALAEARPLFADSETA